MKYSVATIIRAAIAAITAAAGAAATGANGVDLAALDIGQWLTIIGTGAVAAGALLTPAKKPGINEIAVASVQDVVTKTAEAHEKLTQQAVDSIGRVIEAVGNLGTLIPLPPGTPPIVMMPPDVVWQRPLGTLAQQVLDSVTPPRPG